MTGFYLARIDFAKSPTKSLCGPTSLEFQFHEDTLVGQLQYPSWCLDVKAMYFAPEAEVEKKLCCLVHASELSCSTNFVMFKVRQTKLYQKTHCLYQDACSHATRALAKLVECLYTGLCCNLAIVLSNIDYNRFYYK